MYLNVQWKEDSAEKLAAVAGKPTKNYLFALEFNTVVNSINTLRHLITLNSGNIDFLIGNTPKLELGTIEGSFIDVINAMEEVNLQPPVFVTYTIGAIDYVKAFVGNPSIYGTNTGLFVQEIDFLPVYSSNDSNPVPTSDLFIGYFDTSEAMQAYENAVDGSWGFHSVGSVTHIGIFKDMGSVIYDPEDEDMENPIPVLDLLEYNIYDPLIGRTYFAMPLTNGIQAVMNTQGFSVQGLLEGIEPAHGTMLFGKQGILCRNHETNPDGMKTTLKFEKPLLTSEITIPNEQGNRTMATREYLLPIQITTTLSVDFSRSKIYYSPSSPATGNITNDLTAAKHGFVQKIYHSHSSAPTVPAGWVKLGGDYAPGALNIIFAEWVESSRVEYWIINEPE